MSTRCTITVRGADHEFTVYRHSDGYPDTEHGVIATLADALPYAWKLPRFEASDFAAAIVAAWKKPAGPKYGNYDRQGGNIYLTTGRDAHGDTEFHYEVSQDAKGRVVVRTYEATYPTTPAGNEYLGDGPVWVRKGRDHVIG